MRNVYVLICMEGSQIISVQSFSTKAKALEEKRLIETEESYSDDLHAVTIHPRPIQ